MRRDPSTFRPRINKFNSVKDKEQKVSSAHEVGRCTDSDQDLLVL